MSSEEKLNEFVAKFRSVLTPNIFAEMIEAGLNWVTWELNDFAETVKSLPTEAAKKTRKPRAKKTEAEPPAPAAATSAPAGEQRGDTLAPPPAEPPGPPAESCTPTDEQVLEYLLSAPDPISVGELATSMSLKIGKLVEGKTVSVAIRRLIKDGRALWVGGNNRGAKYRASSAKRSDAESAPAATTEEPEE